MVTSLDCPSCCTSQSLTTRSNPGTDALTASWTRGLARQFPLLLQRSSREKEGASVVAVMVARIENSSGPGIEADRIQAHRGVIMVALAHALEIGRLVSQHTARQEKQLPCLVGAQEARLLRVASSHCPGRKW